MMTSRTGVEPIREAVRQPIAAGGLVLDEIHFSRAGSRSVVRIVVDLPEDAIGSVDLDTLSEVSRAVSTALDTAQAVHGAYTLEVSTPGTNRTLDSVQRFKRARTRVVRVQLRDKSVVEGRLLAVAEAEQVALVIDTGGANPIHLPYDDVAFGNIQVELTRLSDNNDDAQEA